MRAVSTVVALVVLAGLAGARADAVTSIAAPRGNPYHVSLDDKGRPIAFTVEASGFPPGSLVYVEQCDALPPSAPNWAPTRNCDIGTSPAAAIVDPTGHARFAATDPNHAFQPFVGSGPESLFNCLPAKAPSPKNGLPDYRSCQLRVASNNTQSTADQVFLPLVFEAAASSSKSSFPASAVIAATVILALALLLPVALARRRRARRTA